MDSCRRQTDSSDTACSKGEKKRRFSRKFVPVAPCFVFQQHKRAPESAPGIRRRRVRAPPRSTRKRNKRDHFSCNAIDQGSVTRTAGLQPGECFSVHYATFCWPMRSTFHVWDTVFDYTARVRGCARMRRALKFENSLLYCNGSSVV